MNGFDLGSISSNRIRSVADGEQSRGMRVVCARYKSLASSCANFGWKRLRSSYAPQVFDSPRAGDFLVSANPGYDLRLRNERVEHRSCHGSLHREHMRVPFAISRPIGTRLPRTVDVFNTILGQFGHPVPTGVDGHDLAA